MYKESKDPMTNAITTIIRLNDGAAIPMVESNTDYQAFLAWKAEGNEPLPADEPEQS